MKKIILLASFLVFAFSLNFKEAFYKSYNYEKMGAYKDAIKVLIPLFEKYPNNYTIHLRLGYLFFMNGNYQNALKHYRKASSILPYSAEAKLGMMRVYLVMNDYDDVLKIGNILLKEDLFNYYGNLYEIKALENKKDYKTAIAIVNKMLYLYPTDVLFLSELGFIYEKVDKAKARAIYENVLILDPNNVRANNFFSKK